MIVTTLKNPCNKSVELEESEIGVHIPVPTMGELKLTLANGDILRISTSEWAEIVYDGMEKITVENCDGSTR